MRGGPCDDPFRGLNLWSAYNTLLTLPVPTVCPACGVAVKPSPNIGSIPIVSVETPPNTGRGARCCKKDSLGTGASQEIHRLAWTLHSKIHHDRIHDVERSCPPNLRPRIRLDPIFVSPRRRQFACWSSMTKKTLSDLLAMALRATKVGKSRPQTMGCQLSHSPKFGPDAVVLDVMLPI